MLAEDSSTHAKGKKKRNWFPSSSSQVKWYSSCGWGDHEGWENSSPTWWMPCYLTFHLRRKFWDEQYYCWQKPNFSQYGRRAWKTIFCQIGSNNSLGLGRGRPMVQVNVGAWGIRKKKKSKEVLGFRVICPKCHLFSFIFFRVICA